MKAYLQHRRKQIEKTILSISINTNEFISVSAIIELEGFTALRQSLS